MCSKRRGAHNKALYMLSSQLVNRKQHSGDKLFHFLHPFSEVVLELYGCWIVNPLTCKNYRRLPGKDISVCFIFLLPVSSGLLVSGLVKRLPLNNLFQTISSSAIKGNSESDVMLTTTCIACFSVLNYSCGVSKISVFFFF